MKGTTILAWIFVFIVVGIVILFQVEKKKKRIRNPRFTTGIITGKSSVGKGDRYVDYKFVVDQKEYHGSMPIDFCNDCQGNCCAVGMAVKVRYLEGNPTNNDLVR
jgi:hypothetical protein